jgi:hypothetical protein
MMSEPTKSPGFLAAWRDSLAAVRETAVLIVLIAFVLFPEAMGARL